MNRFRIVYNERESKMVRYADKSKYFCINIAILLTMYVEQI